MRCYDITSTKCVCTRVFFLVLISYVLFVVRARPLSTKENGASEESIVTFPGSGRILVRKICTKPKTKNQFEIDRFGSFRLNHSTVKIL